MNATTIDTDTPDAIRTLTDLLEQHTGDILVVEEFVDHFTTYAYFIPFPDEMTLQRRWRFKNDHHTAHTNPTPIGTWSSSRRSHEDIAQQIAHEATGEITITELGTIEITEENPANTKFLVDISEPQFDTHTSLYFEGHQVEPPEI